MDNHFWLMKSNQLFGATGYASRFSFYEEMSESDLDHHPWYFGNIERDMAESLLVTEANMEGSFLVRFSSRKNQLVLSLRCLQREKTWGVHHYIIERSGPYKHSEAGKYFLEDRKEFLSLAKLIEFYSKENSKILATLLTNVCNVSNPLLDNQFLKDWEGGKSWKIPEKEIKIEKTLGSGFFGKVEKGKWQGGTPVAVKSMKLDSAANPQQLQMFQNEMELMKELSHPNLVKMFGILEEKQGIVQEFCKHGDIANYLKTKKEKKE